MPCDAMTKRNFDEISVVDIGWQGVEGRFDSEPQFNLPPLSQWRCNLVGMALHHVTCLRSPYEYDYVRILRANLSESL